MSSLTWAYVALFNVAFAILVIGLARKIYVFAKTPAPLKIPTTPAPTAQTGVVLRMFREVAFFESLFKSTKWTWIFGWVFHMALFAVLFRHLRYFQDPVWFPVAWTSSLFKYLAFGMIVGLLGLWARRLFVDRVKYITVPSDHLMLLLLLLIGISGALTTFVTHTDVVAVKAFFLGRALRGYKPWENGCGSMVRVSMPQQPVCSPSWIGASPRQKKTSCSSMCLTGLRMGTSGFPGWSARPNRFIYWPILKNGWMLPTKINLPLYPCLMRHRTLSSQ